MKKIFTLFFILEIFLVGCAGRQLSDEGYKITSVSDTSNCEFVRAMTTTTQPHNIIYYVQLNTERSGGDSYKILTTTSQSLLVRNDAVITNFEVWKCRK